MKIVSKIKRRIIHAWQKLTRGFSDRDLWSLDYTIAKFALPRLKEFKNYSAGFPAKLNSQEEWDEIIDSMIYFLSYTVDDSNWYTDKYDAGKIKEGRENFAEYFNSLWT